MTNTLEEQLDLEGNFIKKWDSITEASLKCGKYVQNISDVCRGKRKTCGGFKWEYL